MNVRPLRLLGASWLAAVDAVIEAAVAAWAAEWGIGADGIACTSSPACEAGTRVGHWRHGWRAGEAAAWVDWPAHIGVEIERAMFAQGQLLAPAQAGEPALAPAAAGAALDALLALLAERICPAQPRDPMLPGQQPEREWLPLSGAILLEVDIGGAALSCLLNADAVHTCAGGTPPRQDQALPRLAALKVSDALGPVPLALPVKLGTVDVDLASLMTVGIGDVIRLDVALDRRLEVSTPDGKPLFAAHLGRSGDQVAIEVAASL